MGYLIKATVPAGSSAQQGTCFGPNMGCLQYAVNQGAWWAFWFDLDANGQGAAGKLNVYAKYSTDLQTWSTPTPSSYTLGGTRVSYNQWCVAYQNLGAGYDIVFVTRQDNFNSSSGPWYARFALSSSWSKTNGDTYLTALDGSNGFPDAVTFDSSGYPVVGAPGNMSISSNQDAGSSWTAAWGTAKSVAGNCCGVMLPMSSRNLLSIGLNSGTTTGNYYSSYWNGSTWGTATQIFTTNWNTLTYPETAAFIQLNYTSVHAVACDLAHSYAWNHRIWNGSTWSNGGTIPALTPYTQSAVGNPVALTTDGTNIWLFAVETTTYNVKYVKYDGGAGTWGSWATADAGDSSHARINLCGAQQGNGNYPACTYLQANGSNWDLYATGIQLVPPPPPGTFSRPWIAYRDVHFSEFEE